ncbi:MAG: hypothetical protein HY652_15905 [Acidobacteria bacterium]|nr:hypothetical protein [Acidobacteriota bacterium]
MGYLGFFFLLGFFAIYMAILFAALFPLVARRFKRSSPPVERDEEPSDIRPHDLPEDQKKSA